MQNDAGTSAVGPKRKKRWQENARHQSWVEIGRGGEKPPGLVLKQSGDNRELPHQIEYEQRSPEYTNYLTRYSASKEN